MSIIEVNRLSFAYEGSYDKIFDDVSFVLDTDWKLGFIGRNGRGKTTFLNLLKGEYEYNGTINSSVEFEYFPYFVDDPEQDTVEIICSISVDAEYWMIQKELNLLEVDADVLYRPFSSLSNGEQTKVLLAALFLKENCFLLIDEPTNHLDIRGRKILGEYLKRKKGYILVSHDRTLLDSCIDHVLSINRANIDIQTGNFSSWWENKRREDNYELDENDRLKKDIKRLRESAMRTKEKADSIESSKIGNVGIKVEKSMDRRAYIGAKSKNMQQRRKNIENRQNREIEEKSKLLKNIEKCDSLKISPIVHHKNTLVSVSDLSINYGYRTVCSGVSFSVSQGEMTVLKGSNGCGKSSIIKLITGENIPHSGRVEIANGLKISYVPQSAGFLKGDIYSFIYERGIDESLFMTILRKLGFDRVQFDKNLEEYSAGQKKKVLLAASLCESAHLYIWDEPLNYIDVLSRIQIENLLIEYKPTLLLIEHDELFCSRIATKIIEI